MLSKKILLAGIAAGALAAAGSAGAATTTSAKVSTVALTVATGAVTAPYTLANEAILTTAANTKTTVAAGDNSIASTLSAAAGNFAPNGGGTTYAVTYTLTGATFQNPVTTGNFAVSSTQTPGTTCAPTGASVVAGGGAGQSSVTYIFTVPTSCTSSNGAAVAPNTVTTDIPFAITAGSTSVSETTAFTLATSGVTYDTSASATLVSRANGYLVSVSANPGTTSALPTQFSLSSTPAYAGLVANQSGSFDNIIGSYNAGLSATTAAANAGNAIYASMSAQALPALIHTVAVTATSGAFTVIAPAVASNDANALAGTTSIALPLNTAKTVGTSAAAQTATVTGVPNTIFVTASGTTPSTGSVASSATVTPAFAAASTLVTVPAAVTGALETVTLQGTNIVAPWVTDGSNAFNSIIRIANINNGAIPAYTVTLLNPSTTGTSGTAVAGVCSFASPGTAQATISSSQLGACFGNFGNSDIRIVLQSPATNFSAKLRIVNGTTGVVTEQSLGTGQNLTFGTGIQ